MSKFYIKDLNIKDPTASNCVSFARKRYSKLPYGLFTIGNKKNIINSCNPVKGCVAIMDVGTTWGHVGIVKKVGSHHVTIIEANFHAGKITERHGTEEDLRIIGYFI